MIPLIGLYLPMHTIQTMGVSLDTKAQSLVIENSQEYYQIEVPRDTVIVRLHGMIA